MAVASQILGIFSALLSLLFAIATTRNRDAVLFFPFSVALAIVALVFGHAARGKIRRSGGAVEGRLAALAGLAGGYITCALFVLFNILASVAGLLGFGERIQPTPVGSLRTLNTAAITYASTYGRGFPSSLAALGPPQEGKPPDAQGASLIDEVLASGGKSRYVFTYRVTANDDKGFPSAYTINADPVDAGMTEEGHVFTDESGVIRRERDHPANKDSPPLM